MIKVWKYALGSFSDEKTKDVDNQVVIIRSLIFLSYLITNCFIISGVIRHWNPRFHNNYHNNTEAGTHEDSSTSRPAQGQISCYTKKW